MKNYFVIGDIHGDYKRIRDFCQKGWRSNHFDENKENNILICLGDFGANFFFNYRDEVFKERLGKYPFTYFVIRGNHEERPSNLFNIDTWHMENFEQGAVYIENNYPYIKYALDYPSLYALNDKWLTIVYPGAYSVDKYYRIEKGWGWFEGEQLDDNEKQIGRELAQEVMTHFHGCDLILSHTCPIIYEPTDLFLSTVDQSMIDKTMERYLGEIEYNLKYKLWLWGHYHQTRIYPDIDNNSYRCMLFDDYVLDLTSLMNRLTIEKTNAIYTSLFPTWKENGHIVNLNH